MFLIKISMSVSLESIYLFIGNFSTALASIFEVVQKLPLCSQMLSLVSVLNFIFFFRSAMFA